MLYEKALSKKQQRFFGIVRATQKGTFKGETTPQVQRAAASMKKKDVKKFASTKHKGLPEKKINKEEKSGDMNEDFYRKKFTVKDGYKKTNKMTKSNKRSGDSKAQYREVHKDLAKYKIKKLKTEGSLHSWFKGSKSKDGSFLVG